MRTTPTLVLALALCVVAAGPSAGLGATREPARQPAAARNRLAAKPAATAATAPRVRVLFSPGGGCTEAIVEAIGRAKSSVDVQAYSFTSPPIAKAVAAAHGRGVKVRVVLDKSQRTERYTSATFLYNAGVPVWIDAEHAIAHNKTILIDRATVITGSFNFTRSAEERNAENLLIIEGNRDVSTSYHANFEEHLAHAERYDGVSKAGEAGAGPDGDDHGAEAPGDRRTQRTRPAAKAADAKPRSRKAA